MGAALLARAWCRVVPVRYLRRSPALRSSGLPGDGPERAPRLPAGVEYSGAHPVGVPFPSPQTASPAPYHTDGGGPPGSGTRQQ